MGDVSECPASISGACLQVSMGFALCRDGECDGAVMDALAAELRERAVALGKAPPRRSRRLPATGRLTTQDCPDDAPDGTCWDCGAHKSRPHREDCATAVSPS